MAKGLGQRQSQTTPTAELCCKAIENCWNKIVPPCCHYVQFFSV